MPCSPLLEVKAKIGGDFCGVKFIQELGGVWGPEGDGEEGDGVVVTSCCVPCSCCSACWC